MKEYDADQLVYLRLEVRPYLILIPIIINIR